MAAGFVAGLTAGVGGGILDGWQAWRVAHTIGADVLAGVNAAMWNFTTVIPLAVGLTAALVIGTPAAALLIARQQSVLRVVTIGGLLVTIAAVAMWPFAEVGISTVSIKTIQWLCGADWPSNSGSSAIAHYYNLFIPTRATYWGLIESIVFALTLFGWSWVNWHSTVPGGDRRGRALRVLLGTAALTVVFATAFVVIADHTYGEQGIQVVSS